MARKTKDFYEVTPALLKKVERLASRGLTQEQIAHSLGWCEDTIHAKKKEHPELTEAIKRGQAKGLETVSNALFKRAKGFTVKETHEEARVDEKGKKFQQKKVVTKKVHPDTTAAIFYLKNRDPENWKDVQDHKISGDIIINADSDDDQL